MRDYFGTNSPIRFVFPIDGDCINPREGEVFEGGIRIKVTVQAPKGHEVTVCGNPAIDENGFYVTTVELRAHKNTLCARDLTDGCEQKITVCYLPKANKKYRLLADDNILFLADLNEHKDEYESIFENPYLAIYKKAHDLYGAKVHINLFFQFDAAARKYFSADRPDFDLTRMTDRFRDEFRANGDWLKLSFHSKAEHPFSPYGKASADEITRDCIQLNRELLRFAGPEVFSDCTTIHFAETTEEGTRALRSLGYRALEGDFVKSAYPCGYHYPEEMVDHIMTRDFYYDPEIDIFFCRTDIVLNDGTPDENMEKMRKLIETPSEGGYLDILIHEQYFYEVYKYHKPDFAERVLLPCQFLWENGYTGEFISDVIRELPVVDFPHDKIDEIKI
jgi:hypothetical protein